MIARSLVGCTCDGFQYRHPGSLQGVGTHSVLWVVARPAGREERVPNMEPSPPGIVDMDTASIHYHPRKGGLYGRLFGGFARNGA
jgi:hypothetical protein